jgi:aspartyl/glutamyl-tRNA(Asn/Gln) amidotransferase C subunit
MTLNDAEFNQLLSLAHLDVAEAKRGAFKENLGKIFNHMEQLATLDLEGVSPNAWEAEQETPKRDDVVSTVIPPFTDSNAPVWEDGCFRVPAILGGES